ncbi:MAG: gliding motility-associated C-terminal domain-containing protein [Flavobacteriales bacterium]|nr:gliding motility-associated C-terminal domain-containing protein [Flavobacteriales bacterium]
MNIGKSLLLFALLSLFAIGNTFAADFYWVGNSGNWNDASHWSNTSGGTGGTGTPSSNDDVFFDFNSFTQANQKVTITNNISFNNITIPSRILNFELTSTQPVNIDVYGTMNVSAIFKNNLTGIVNLKSNNTSTKQMNFGNWNWNTDFNFEGKGSYVLNSPLLTPENTVTLTKGNLNLNLNDIVCSSFIANSGQKRKLISNGSDILATNQWTTSTTKFDYDFTQTTIYVLSSDLAAVNKDNDTYNVIQSQTNNATANKTIFSITIFDDTVSCGNTCDGMLYIDNVVTDCSPYTVTNWIGALPPAGPPWGDTIVGQCPGSYTAILIDNCGNVNGQAANIVGHPPITPIQEIINTTSCNSLCDGSISVTVIGANYANMVFTWIPAGFVTTAGNTTSNTTLCAGPVSLQVTDGFGCDTTFLYNVPEPDSLFVNVAVIDPLCFGECSGSATSTPNGGTAPYSYVWTAPPATPTDTFATINNLCAGIAYTLTVTDISGCSNDTIVTPSSPPQIILDSSSTAISCGGACDGTATVTVLGGGTGPFTHNWSNGTVFVGNVSTINGLCPNTYCDTVIDANGCDTIYCFVIAEPLVLTTSTATTDLTCNGICNGTAITTPVGGAGGFNFVWTAIPVQPFGGQGTDSIFNLCPGQYFVVVTDGNGCFINDTITISEPPLLVANPTGTNITCPGFNDGTATANPTGGTGAVATFTYVWTGPLCSAAPYFTQSIASLCPGTYIVTVTDSVGCTAVDSVVISEPPALNLVMSSTDESCAGVCDGTAVVNATGGYAPLSYTWVPDPGVPNGQGTDSIFNLCPALYTVTVTDSAGCTANNNITVNPAPPIVDNLVTSDLTCNGVCNSIATVSPTGGTGPYTVEWDGSGTPLATPNTISNLCPGPHTALITDALGCTLLVNFVINQPPALTTTTTTNDVSCFGVCDGTASTNANGGSGVLNYVWDQIPTGFTGGGQGTDSIFNLCSGTYYVVITDDSLCTVNDTIVIFEPSEIFPNATFTDITCNGLNDGTATATPTGGQPPYVSIVWNTLPAGPVIPGNPINNLGPGQYEVTVTDINGCTGIDTITITDPPVLTVSADATAASCGTICDGAALATPSGGTGNPGNYTYTWTGPGGPYVGNPISNLCFGTYTVTVTDSMGCTAQDTTVINNIVVIGITTTAVGISCNGTCDGTATAVPSGGCAPYTYQWSGNVAGPNDTLITVSNLCPGMIYVTVTDCNGCSSLDSIQMPIAPPVLFPNGSLDQPVSCNGLCDAMVSHSPTGGTPPYTSVWTLPNGIDTNNVCPTFAVITVTDAAGCVQPDTIFITDPTPIIPNDVVVDVLCNGDSTGSITLNPTGGTGGTYTINWISGPIIGSGLSTNNLPSGIYTIDIIDSNGCTITVIDTINEPPVFSSIPIGIDVSCNGLCDGIMAVTVNGGLPPYSYVWANSSPPTLNATGDTLFNVCAPFLSNSVIVTDSNGCQTTQSITIIEPLVLAANVTGTPIGCSSTCDGTALSTPSGGTAPYTFLWTPSPLPADSTGITGLCIGNYLVTVTDNSGCIDTVTYTVTAPLALAVTLDSTNITCNGANDGTATANPSGGTLPYTYLWVGPVCNPNPGNTQTITGLCPGVYTVTVTDSNNCIFIGSIIIEEPQLIDDNEVIVGANCGVNDGSICMFPSGGTPPYSHSWSNGATTSCITNLAAGFYTDTITDFNGCVAIFTIGVTNPTGPSGIAATVNDATCFGACDGSLNAIPIGGVAPFTWAWTGPSCPAQCPSDSTITGLCAGTYNLTLTENSTGCILTTSLVIGEADSITANSTFTDASCNGICDGIASVTPTGGTAPYSYVWSSNGSTSSSISGLCTGPISVTITDFNGCTNVVNFVIASPNALVIASSTIDATCIGNCDGSATANPIGGTAPYNYQWNDPLAQTTQTATGLCAGIYIVTVTDFNGCSGNDTVVINEPIIIIDNAITTNSTCGNADGTASVCASSGGTGIHTYNWPTLGSNVCNVAGLAAGTYPVEITDANGCTETFLITISDVNGPTVLVNTTNASCNGVCDGQATANATGTPNFTYLWTTPTSPPQPTTQTITGLCAGNYSVQVTDGNGCITTQPVTITDNTSITATVNTIDATCNGSCDGSALVVPNGGLPPYSYSWAGGNAAGQTINAVGGLCVGNYTVTITDALGCSFIQNVVINEPNLLTVTVAGVAANCSGACDGQATANPTGGTGPFTYLWSNGATTPTITALCAGNYTVIITDANGCTGNGNVTIGDGNSITATINTVDAACGACDGSITVLGGGGSGAPFTYLWSPLGQITPTISNLCPGAYQVDITDNVGCTQQFNILINNANGPSLTTLADSVTCFGSCDGLAYTTITAGNPNYIFQWDDPALTTNDSATTLCAGLYNVIVQDALGCITVDSVTVLEPQEILANIISTPPSCPGVCDGTATINPTGGVGILTILWGASAGNQVTPTATGLCAGTHTITITDANGCSITDSITLSDPTNISITISSTLPTCAGDCDGTAIANAAGGTPPYTYSWNTVPVSNNSLVGGLCAGTYIVTVTDNNGCTDTASVQVIDPPVLTTVSVPNPLTCSGVCNGSITTTPAGGVAPYTYIWSNGDTTQTTVNTLCAGVYWVTVIDANNCTINDTTTLIASPVLNDNTVITGPSCGVCDGSITSTPIGGVGPFDFVWTDPLSPIPALLTDLGVATSTVVGLCAGTVDLEITDLGTGCIYNYTLIINNINGPTLVMTSTDETCVGACDGTATATPSGGTSPYSYSWVPVGPPTDTLQTYTGLCVGLYTVTVTDSNNCISSDTISINSNGLNLTITSVIPETCFGNCDGSSTVSVTGGIPNYTYLWDDPSNQVTPQATGLCVGNYIVTVSDSALCSDSISTNITGPQLLVATASVNTPVSCNGICDGAAIANVVGGTANYTYAWNDPANQTTQIATGLCAGTYIVTVTDNNGCTEMDTITLTEPTAILANETLIDPACGVCDGSITIATSGGIGPYTYLWTTPTAPILTQPITSTLINLCAGAYTVTITDSSGCIANFNFPLSNINAPVPNTTVTNISCNGVCDGQITSAPTGGTAPYTYFWNPTGNTSPTITGLCAGQYTLDVTDAAGCIGIAIDSVTQPAVLQANINASNLNCNSICDGWAISNTIGGTSPFTYNWTPAGQITVGQGTDSISSLCAGTYFVTITDSNTCNTLDSIVIIEPTSITAASTFIDVTCTANCDGSATFTPAGGTGPYTFEWNGNTTLGQGNTQTNLCFGLNIVEIFDQNGCSIIDSVNIGATDTVLADAGLDTTICLGSSANLTGIPSGVFTNVEWFELPGMNSLGTTNSITVLPSVIGVTCYAFQVTGACAYSDTICVTVDPLPIANAGFDVTIFDGASTTLNATGGFTYTWTPGTDLSDSTISNPIASPTVTTTYYVTVTSPNGCIATDSVIVTVLPNIIFPDGISPNGDGANDVWIIDFIEQFPNNVVEIYNRWGELLFHADGYLQDWDGTYNGEELPIGTYYYIIDLHEESIKPFTGPLTILR